MADHTPSERPHAFLTDAQVTDLADQACRWTRSQGCDCDHRIRVSLTSTEVEIDHQRTCSHPDIVKGQAAARWN